MLQLALVRLVEIIGEAAARLSDDLQTKHSDIPWNAIVGMRNRLVIPILTLIWMWCGIRSRSRYQIY